MSDQDLLLLPGPTQVPQRVMAAMNEVMINHRGTEFAELMHSVSEKIQKIYQTKKEIIFFNSSGTGAMEAAVTNFINPGDKVLVAVMGGFGERFCKLLETYGATPIRIEADHGQVADTDEISKILAKDTKHEIKAVFVTHNETSTGVYMDLEALNKARGEHPALTIVDSISSLSALGLKTDEWNLDVVLTASQKAFMTPPGLSMMSVSSKAFQVAKNCQNRCFYFDVLTATKFKEQGQTPYTPSISLFYALNESLKIIEEIGLENIVAKHYLHRDMVRSSMRALGFSLLAADEVASPALTSVVPPASVNTEQLISRLKDYHVSFAGGQGKLKGEIFRFGHLGYVKSLDILAAISAVEMVLYEMNYGNYLGVGVKAAEAVMLNKDYDNNSASVKSINVI